MLEKLRKGYRRRTTVCVYLWILSAYRIQVQTLISSCTDGGQLIMEHVCRLKILTRRVLTCFKEKCWQHKHISAVRIGKNGLSVMLMQVVSSWVRVAEHFVEKITAALPQSGLFQEKTVLWESKSSLKTTVCSVLPCRLSWYTLNLKPYKWCY